MDLKIFFCGFGFGLAFNCINTVEFAEFDFFTNGSFFTVHEIIAYNKITWIYFIVVLGFGFNYLDLDRIRIFIKVNPLLSELQIPSPVPYCMAWRSARFPTWDMTKVLLGHKSLRHYEPTL